MILKGNLMRKSICLLAAFLLAGTVNAAYLYWQVDSADFKGTEDFVTGDTIDVDAEYATVWAVQSPDGAPVALSAGEGTKISVGSGGAVINLSQLGDPTAYSFYIELVNFNGATFDFAGRSQTFSYVQLQESNFIDVGESILPPTQVWHGGSYTVTPEPTSGLLVMFGIGLLALKRKKV